MICTTSRDKLGATTVNTVAVDANDAHKTIGRISLLGFSWDF